MAQELNRFRELDVGQEIEVSAPVVEEAAPVVQKASLGKIKSPQTAEALKQFMGSDATSEPAKHYHEQLKKALGSDSSMPVVNPESGSLKDLIRKKQEEATAEIYSRFWSQSVGLSNDLPPYQSGNYTGAHFYPGQSIGAKPLSKHQVFELYQPYRGSWDNPEPPF